MASLEDYLRNFATAGSGFAFPTNQHVVIETLAASSSQGAREYYPPSNGFLVLWLEAVGACAEVREDGGVHMLSTNQDSTWAKVAIPCARGRRYNYVVFGTSIKQGEFYFVPSLGSQ